MTQKQKLFISYYTAPGTETYQNGTKSAQKAGYTGKNVAITASNLIRHPKVLTEINKQTDAIIQRAKLSREKKAEIALENFHKSHTDSARKFWWREHGELSGHYVQKIESDNKTKLTVEDVQDEVADIARQYTNRLQQDRINLN